jgi:hypothetical protein
MNARKILLVGSVILMVSLGLSGTASAGIDPVPFHVVISNRTDRLDLNSPFYNNSMKNMVVTLRIDLSNVPSPAGQVDVPISLSVNGNNTLAPGETLSFPVVSAYASVTGAQLVSWSFSADVGIDPAPFRTVFAYERADSAQANVAPFLSPDYFNRELTILGFASPGVAVGSVLPVNDKLPEVACPAVPAEPMPAWKNHGQYVAAWHRRPTSSS